MLHGTQGKNFSFVWKSWFKLNKLFGDNGLSPHLCQVCAQWSWEGEGERWLSQEAQHTQTRTNNWAHGFKNIRWFSVFKFFLILFWLLLSPQWLDLQTPCLFYYIDRVEVKFVSVWEGWWENYKDINRCFQINTSHNTTHVVELYPLLMYMYNKTRGLILHCLV